LQRTYWNVISFWSIKFYQKVFICFRVAEGKNPTFQNRKTSRI
jgi:hypothetical protein